jgi:microcompartment protein CcmK/EutM
MIVQPINPNGTAEGDELLALDSVDAGVGDTVVVVREGWSASTSATGQPGAAIDSAIVGVVDTIEYESR